MMHQVQIKKNVRKQEAQDELEEAVKDAMERRVVVEHSRRVNAALAALLEAVEEALEA